MSTAARLEQDTIAAIATAPGRGGVGIIRLSGPCSLAITEQICACTLTPRHAYYCSFSNSTTAIDSGIALYFKAPHSFTGEDVTELHAHGGPVVLDLLLQAVFELGARPAEAGEFSKRAFLNNKIDLAQAEAIADLINSSTEQAAVNANRSLQGEFSKKIHQLVEAVTHLRIYVEAAIDFPEEEIDFLGDGKIASALTATLQQMQAVLAQAQQGSIIQEGMKLVIAGKPNAGKSSLLNALAGKDRAIVTAVEGTTRDVLTEYIQIDGMPLHIVDTAGLRHSNEEVEQEGIRRATEEMASADRILLLVDGRNTKAHGANFDGILGGDSTLLPKNIPITVIRNKCDLTGTAPHIEKQEDPPVIHLSAKTGDGINLLRQHLKQCAGYSDSAEGLFSARRRHLLALQRAQSYLLAGQTQLQHSAAGELLAEDLRQCQQTLGEITGEFSADDLLGEIFSSFCIGK